MKDRHYKFSIFISVRKLSKYLKKVSIKTNVNLIFSCLEKEDLDLYGNYGK